MNQSSSHWTILGAGAVGHLLACRFAASKISVNLIYNQEIPTKCSHVTCVYPDDFSNDVATSVHVSNQQAIHYFAVKHCPPIDCLLLTVKSYQVAAAIAAIKSTLTASSQIFLLQNGMGTLEKVTTLLQDILPPDQIFPGSNTHGVYLQKNRSGVLEIIHAGIGQLVFGANYLQSTQNTEPTCLKDFQQLSLNTAWVCDIERRLWLKLAVSATINPLTAINQCKNGALLQSSNLTEQLENLCSEIATLFFALQINISFVELRTEVFSVIEKTASNYSSMFQDINSKKITEIEAITGYLLKMSYKCGINMKLNRMLYQTLTTNLDG